MAATAWVARPLRPTSASPYQLGPDPLDVVGVLADHLLGDLLGVRVLPRAARPLGVAIADTLMSFEGGDLGEEEGDLRHRLLSAGQHLGVADGAVEREERQRERARGDLVLAGLASPARRAAKWRSVAALDSVAAVRAR